MFYIQLVVKYNNHSQDQLSSYNHQYKNPLSFQCVLKSLRTLQPRRLRIQRVPVDINF